MVVGSLASFKISVRTKPKAQYRIYFWLSLWQRKNVHLQFFLLWETWTIDFHDNRVVIVSPNIWIFKTPLCSFWQYHPFQGLPFLDIKIKWPNDLYLNGLKVGGILCTSTYKSKKFNVSAGKYIIFFCFSECPCFYIAGCKQSIIYPMC